jgi:hypothetical protein
MARSFHTERTRNSILQCRVRVDLCGLRRGSTVTRLLELWVRIPPGAWMSVSCECCLLSGRGLCDGLVTRPEESYRVWCVLKCVIAKSRKMRRPRPPRGCRAIGKQKEYFYFPTSQNKVWSIRVGVCMIVTISGKIHKSSSIHFVWYLTIVSKFQTRFCINNTVPCRRDHIEVVTVMQLARKSTLLMKERSRPFRSPY